MNAEPNSFAFRTPRPPRPRDAVRDERKERDDDAPQAAPRQDRGRRGGDRASGVRPRDVAAHRSQLGRKRPQRVRTGAGAEQTAGAEEGETVQDGGADVQREQRELAGGGGVGGGGGANQNDGERKVGQGADDVQVVIRFDRIVTMARDACRDRGARRARGARG